MQTGAHPPFRGIKAAFAFCLSPISENSCMTSSWRNLRKQGLRLAAIVGALLGTGIFSLAQDIPLPSDDYTPKLKKRNIPDHLPSAPSIPPAFSIAVTPLGFGAPGPTYLGRHYALASLDFLDANHLLFTFRAPGLMHRTLGEGADELRQMRAVVLNLPGGSIASEAVWTVPGLDRYVWMLKDGRFLLRDRGGLRIGDDKLATKPFLPLAGALVALQIDPTQKLLLASSYEPAKDTAGKSEGDPAAGQKASSLQDIMTRLVDLDTGEVRSTQRATAPSALPVDADGHVVVVHDKLDQWSLRVNSFTGASRVLGHVESTCLPTLFLASEREILVTGCNPAHTPKLTAVSTTNGQQLWETEIPAPIVPPQLLASPDGSLLLRETVVFNQGVKPNAQTLWIKAVKGQVVRVFDAASGKLLLETPANPTLDGGGNVAISPSGRYIAVLNDGNIEVFDLPSGPH